MLIWDQFLILLEKDLGPETVRKWVRPLKIEKFDAANLYLLAENSFQISWFEEHVRPKLKETFFNNNQRPIQVHLRLTSSIPKENVPLEKGLRFPLKTLKIESCQLDPELTFDHFLVSEENKISFEIIKECQFNPIFLYGPKSSGKTHLLVGAAHQMQKMGKKVFFISASQFTEHVVAAIRQGLMQEFRKTYREIDALIVDNVDVFSRKTATQEEFFHTFNTLHTQGKQILLSASVPPSQLVDIEPRLISRFEWGISLKIEKKEPRSVLEKKCVLWNFPLTEELLEYLLSSFPSNPIMALQALILRSDKKSPLTPLVAEKLLLDLREVEKEHQITPEKIIKKIAEHFSLNASDLLGKSQLRETVLPRQIAMFLCRKRLKLPYQKIGALFSKDHSTVMTSVKAIENLSQDKNQQVLEALKFFI